MSQANIEHCLHGLAAFSRGDMEALIETFDPAIRVFDDPQVPGARTHDGLDGTRRFYYSFSKYWESWAAEPGEIRAEGEYVLFLGRFSGTSKSGVRVDSPAGWLTQVKRGRSVQIHVYYGDLARAEKDYAEAIAQHKPARSAR